MQIEEKIFEVADEWLIKEMKREKNMPIMAETETGVWIGTLHFMLKIEPFNTALDNQRIDYRVLENMYSFLGKMGSGKQPDINSFLDQNLPQVPEEELHHFEVNFKEITVDTGNMTGLSSYSARVYTCYDDNYPDCCGLVHCDLDYPIWKLDLKFVTKGSMQAIVGLKDEGETLKERAVIGLMPLRINPPNTVSLIRKQHSKTEKLFDEFYAEKLEKKEDANA